MNDQRIITDLDVDWNPEAVLSGPPFTRWSTMGEKAAKLETVARTFIDDIDAAIDPKAMYAVRPTEEVALAPYDPPSPLGETSHVVAAVVTIGSAVDDLEPDGDGLTAEFVCETLKNLALMRARQRFAELIRARLAEAGLGTSGVIAPGSELTDWDMAGQGLIAAEVEAERIGVSLAAGELPDPDRTYTFAMAAGEGVESAEQLFTCTGCEKCDTCPYVGVGCGSA
jgi:hypothetical protein